MVDFNKLRQMSGKGSLDRLIQETNKINGGQSNSNDKDDRFWYPNVDKAGNGYAVIRFLPPPADEDMPFVRIFSHGFKGPTGSWYIENSLTTLGKPDPVGEYNSTLWNSGIESDKEIARAQKRKLTFISNIYVVTDQQNPENEGKVFLFKYGKKIFDKLNDAMNPQFPDQEPMNPFDLWSGANFKLKIRNVEGYRNYDKSEFGNQAPLFDDDSKMEAIWKKEYSLQEFLAPSNFKSYDELKSKLHRVLGLDSNPNSKPQTKVPSQNELDESYAIANAGKTAEAKAAPKSDAPTAASAAAPWDEEDDDTMAFFKKLAS